MEYGEIVRKIRYATRMFNELFYKHISIEVLLSCHYVHMYFDYLEENKIDKCFKITRDYDYFKDKSVDDIIEFFRSKVMKGGDENDKEI